jgi:hypothetical protein
MNPTESIRLNKTEIDTIVMGCAYNMTSRTLAYNKSRMVSVSLGRAPASVKNQNLPSDPQSEISEEEAARNKSRDSLATALTEIHTRCKSDLESYPKKLALAVSIQSKLLSSKLSPSGTGSFNFTADECEFITDALRTFEQAEVNQICNAEIILAHFYNSFNEDGDQIQNVTESVRQTEAEYKANQTRRDEFICLMAKVINYGKTLSSGSNVGSSANDQ